jgi:hypothetical protein
VVEGIVALQAFQVLIQGVVETIGVHAEGRVAVEGAPGGLPVVDVLEGAVN